MLLQTRHYVVRHLYRSLLGVHFRLSGSGTHLVRDTDDKVLGEQLCLRSPLLQIFRRLFVGPDVRGLQSVFQPDQSDKRIESELLPDKRHTDFLDLMKRA